MKIYVYTYVYIQVISKYTHNQMYMHTWFKMINTDLTCFTFIWSNQNFDLYLRYKRWRISQELLSPLPDLWNCVHLWISSLYPFPPSSSFSSCKQTEFKCLRIRDWTGTYGPRLLNLWSPTSSLKRLSKTPSLPMITKSPWQGHFWVMEWTWHPNLPTYADYFTDVPLPKLDWNATDL